ncbi:hypothetical protein [Flammeovirga aprica]|uniref:Uncharacterized protein n=1 Tax=Flammeovirga aprica JL-4 TaxID=694437 RepID=A0A7X9XCE0_9BACT|nr:hypothetical protein [Flammeovirga aprica]NME71534.1 hypothetical protein [Flammeovirga aprica JL-4]
MKIHRAQEPVYTNSEQQDDEPEFTPEQKEEFNRHFNEEKEEWSEDLKKLYQEFEGNLLEKDRLQQSTFYYRELKKVVQEEYKMFSDLDIRASQLLRLFTKTDYEALKNDFYLSLKIKNELNQKEIIVAIQDWTFISDEEKIAIALDFDDEIPYWLLLKLIKNRSNIDHIKEKGKSFKFNKDLEKDEIDALLKTQHNPSLRKNKTLQDKKDDRCNTDFFFSEVIELQDKHKFEEFSGASPETLLGIKKEIKEKLRQNGFNSEEEYENYIETQAEDFYKEIFLPSTVELVNGLLDESEKLILKEYESVITDKGKSIYDTLKPLQQEFEELRSLRKTKTGKLILFCLLHSGGTYGTSINNLENLDAGYSEAKKKAEEAHDKIRKTIAAEHPVLLDTKIDLLDLYDDYVKDSYSSLGLSNHLRKHLVDRLENIDTVRKNMLDDPEAVLSMDGIIEIAKQRANNEYNISYFNEYVDEKVSDVKIYELCRDLGLALLTIASGIAAVGTAGQASPLLAGSLALVSTTLTGVDLYITHTEYLEKKATANTSIDPKRRLSNDDPWLGWIFIAYAGAILDIADAFILLPRISKALRSGTNLTNELKTLGKVLYKAGKIDNVNDFIREILYNIQKQRTIFNDVYRNLLKQDPTGVKGLLNDFNEFFSKPPEFALAGDINQPWATKMSSSPSGEEIHFMKMVGEATQKYEANEIIDFAKKIGGGIIKERHYDKLKDLVKNFSNKSRLKKVLNTLSDVDKEKCANQLIEILDHDLFNDNIKVFSTIAEKYLINIVKGDGGLDANDIKKIMSHLSMLDQDDIVKYLLKFEGNGIKGVQAKKFLSNIDDNIGKKELVIFLEESESNVKLLKRVLDPNDKLYCPPCAEEIGKRGQIRANTLKNILNDDEAFQEYIDALDAGGYGTFDRKGLIDLFNGDVQPFNIFQAHHVMPVDLFKFDGFNKYFKYVGHESMSFNAANKLDNSIFIEQYKKNKKANDVLRGFHGRHDEYTRVIGKYIDTRWTEVFTEIAEKKKGLKIEEIEKLVALRLDKEITNLSLELKKALKELSLKNKKTLTSFSTEEIGPVKVNELFHIVEIEDGIIIKK